MGTEALSVASAAPSIRSEPALTRRASLTALASLLDYFVKAGVSLVVTPILVGGLGRTLYGVWEMLGRIVGYMAATDGRPTEALRLVISQQQDLDAPTKRRSVGAAVVVWLLMIPLVALVGGTLAWFAPHLTHSPADHYTEVRIACAFLVASFLFTGLAAIPESVLRGMNLGYKRMGLQASLSIIAGGLAACAVHAGWGLPGVGGWLGRGQIARAVQLRRELLTLTWLFVTVVGATTLAWNHSFLSLWVGARNYAGPWVDLLIVLVVAQTAFIRTDSYIIDAALRPKGRVVIGAVTVVATLALGITLTHAFGILGLSLGMLLGRPIQSVSYPLIVRKCFKHPDRTM